MLSVHDLALRRRFVAASQKRHRPRRVAPIPPPRGIALQYQQALVSLSRDMDKAILAELQRENIIRIDAVEPLHPLPSQIERIAALMTKHLARLTSPDALVGMLDRIASRVVAFSRDGWRKQLQAAIGISPTADLGMARQVFLFREANISLIQDLSRDKVDRVRSVLERAGFGKRHEDLVADIQDQLGVTESRAALIARDQTLKLNAEVTQARHIAAGVTDFVWSTSQDERVRESHAELEGKRFQYANPPVVDGETTLPGQAVNCRCVADPIIPGVEE